MYKQIIIARKDLNMSPGKLAAQVSHASMAFLAQMMREDSIKCIKNVYLVTDPDGGDATYDNASLNKLIEEARVNGKAFVYANNEDGVYIPAEPETAYRIRTFLNKGLYEEWINGAFTKCVLEAKNRYQLMKAVDKAKELGMKEGKDFFLIKDNCYTELTPEEIDENGVGRTLTCIGFAPMEDSIIDQIGKRYQLLK